MTYGKRGIFVRIAYLCVAMFYFIASKLSGGMKNGTIVLCYHGVNDSQRLKFAKQLKLIKRQIVSLKNFALGSEQNAKGLSICLTFDDAFANLLSNVIPTITEYRVPITIFIPTGSLGAMPSWLQGAECSDSHELVMSSGQISTLKDNQMVSFGSHTVDHSRLSSLSEEEMREQFRLSGNIISKVVGEAITQVALPHGDYNEVVIKMALKEGYQKIYTLEPKINNATSCINSPLLGRFSVSPDDWPVEFFLTSNGAYSYLHSWRAFIKKCRSFVQVRIS